MDILPLRLLMLTGMKQKNLTLDAFKKIYAEWQASDTTIREFCRTICFDEDKFYFWKKKLLDSRNASSAGFIPVSMSQRNGKISISSPSAARTSKVKFFCFISYGFIMGQR